jgi:hypothetical protein
MWRLAQARRITAVHPLTARSRLLRREQHRRCVRGSVAVSIPQRGCKTPQRRATNDRRPSGKASDSRAGIEAHLSADARPRREALPRRRLRLRAVYQRRGLANNLMIIGELLTKRSRRRRKTNRQFLG